LHEEAAGSCCYWCAHDCYPFVSPDGSDLCLPLPAQSKGNVLPTLINFSRGRRAWCGASSRLTGYRPLLVAVIPAAKEANLRSHDFDRSPGVSVLLLFTNLKAPLHIPS